MGLREDILNCTTLAERAQLRMERVRDAMSQVGSLSLTRGRFQIDWDRLPDRENLGDNCALRHLVTIRRDGNIVFRDAIRQFGIPIMVEHPTNTRIVTLHNGIEVVVPALVVDPVEAVIHDVLHTLRIVTRNFARTHIKDVPGTVSTFYSATGDGYVYSDSAVSWAAVVAGSGLTADTAAAILPIDTFRLGTRRAYESFAAWDTSTIGDTDTIDDATLSTYATGKGGTGTLRAYAYTFGTVTTADWRTNTDLAAATELATIGIAAVTTSAYNDWTQTGTALRDAINKTGTTELCFSEARVEDNSDPGAGTDNYTDMSSADVAGTTQDPKLVVTHTAAGGATNPGWAGAGVW